MLSQEMKDFMTEWYDWAVNGKEVSIFERAKEAGLCECLQQWCDINNLPYLIYGAPSKGLKDELANLFSDGGLNRILPFRPKNFFNQTDMRTDANRVSWVRAALDGKLEEWRFDETVEAQ